VTLIPKPPPDIVASYCCRDDGGFGDQIAAGIDAATDGTDLVVVTVGERPNDLEALAEYARAGTPLILHVSTLGEGNLIQLATDYPDTAFVGMECVDAQPLPNIGCIQPANHEMGFLAGATAGLMTESGQVGIVLGVDTPNMPPFQAGFEHGVRYVNPDVVVDTVYLSAATDYFDLSGFGSPSLGEIAAREMYEGGADVVFAAAGYSNLGVFEAAAAYTERTGDHVWSIGADSDEYLTVETHAEFFSENVPRWQKHILTSIEKRNDVGIVLAIRDFFFEGPGDPIVLTIENGAIDFSRSGGFLNHLVDPLEAVKIDITTGVVNPDAVPLQQPPTLVEFLSR